MSTKSLLAASLLYASSALADDRTLITDQMQALSDAIAVGDVAVWDKYLDPGLIFAEEDGSYKGKPDALKEITALPNGLSGTIQVDLLAYHQDGAMAIALFRQNETEQYFGQTLHARYLCSTTWIKKDEAWRLVAGQVLAEKTDPPSIRLPVSQLRQYEGSYKLKDSAAIYDVKVQGGVLRATRRGRPAVTWNAEARDVFFKDGDPRIRNIFQRDGTGKVRGFVERREMWDIIWEKQS